MSSIKLFIIWTLVLSSVYSWGNPIYFYESTIINYLSNDTLLLKLQKSNLIFLEGKKKDNSKNHKLNSELDNLSRTIVGKSNKITIGKKTYVGERIDFFNYLDSWMNLDTIKNKFFLIEFNSEGEVNTSNFIIAIQIKDSTYNVINCVNEIGKWRNWSVKKYDFTDLNSFFAKLSLPIIGKDVLSTVDNLNFFSIAMFENGNCVSKVSSYIKSDDFKQLIPLITKISSHIQ